MLLNVKKFDKVIDVPPGYRKDSGEDVCYVHNIDPIFHQGDEVTYAWSATLILSDLMCSDTSDKMVQLCDADLDKSNISLFKGNRHDSVAGLLRKNTDFDLRKVNDLGQMKDRAEIYNEEG